MQVQKTKNGNSFFVVNNGKRQYVFRNKQITKFGQQNPTIVKQLQDFYFDDPVNDDIYDVDQDNVYIKTVLGKRFLKKDGKPTDYFNNLSLADKESYEPLLFNKSNEKIAVTFQYVSYGFGTAQEYYDLKSRMNPDEIKIARLDLELIEKRSGSVSIVLPTKIYQELINNYRANKPDIDDVIAIDGTLFLNKYHQHFQDQIIDEIKQKEREEKIRQNPRKNYKEFIPKFYQEIENIKSHFDAIKIFDLGLFQGKKLTIDEIKNLPIRNLISINDEKIYAKGIEYYGKNLQEVLDYNKINHEYLFNNFKKNSCVYTALIKLYHTSNIKVGRKSKARPDSSINYENLFKFFHGEYPNDENADYSLTINQLSRFFEEYRIQATLLDITGREIYTYKPQINNKNVGTAHFKAYISNGHLYHLPNHLNKTIRDQSDVKPATEYFSFKNFSKYKEDFIFNKDDLLTYNFESGKVYRIFYPHDLKELLRWFKETLHYHPQISMSNTITTIQFSVNDSIIYISKYDSDENEARISDGLSDPETIKTYVESEKTFYQTLINKNYLSTYHDGFAKFIYLHKINTATGKIYKPKNNNPNAFALDMEKAYSSILYKTDFIPVTSPFDDFKEYNNEPIKKQYLYVIEFDAKTEIDKIFSSENNRLIYGVNLSKLHTENIFPKIHYYCEMSHTQENKIIPKVMDKIKQKLNVDDWKFIFNKTIGLTGKTTNTNRKSWLFENADEATTLANQFDDFRSSLPTKIKIGNNEEATYYYYAERKSEPVTLSTGFYPIQVLIYDTTRTNLYISALRLSRETNILGVKTDCIYFEPRKSFDVINKIISNIENDLKFTFKPIVEVDKQKIPQFKQYFNKHSKEFVTHREQKILTIKNEMEIDNFSVLENRTLVRANLPGSGKTTNILNYALSQFKANEILAVTPTNALSADIQNKFKIVSCTFCTLAGIIRGKDLETEETTQKFDLTPFKFVLFDEIYNYNVSDLHKIQSIISAHESHITFVACGDIYQNKPIEDFYYPYKSSTHQNDAIESVFYNFLTLNTSRRITDQKQVETLKQIKEDLFLNGLSPLQIITKHKLNTIENVPNRCDYLNICYFNVLCDYINELRPYKKDDLIYVKTRFTIGAKKFQSNYTYKITAINETDFTIEDILLKTKSNLKISYLKNFRGNHIYTGHAVQGITTNKKVIVYNVDSQYANNLWFWVAITRARNLNDVYFDLKLNI